MELELFITSNLNVLKVGGAVSGRCSLLSKRFFNSLVISGIDRNVVFMSMYLKTGLTEPEFKSIYYHEIGHIVKKHDVINTSISQRQKEIEADLYSAKIVGPSVLLSALKKIPIIIKECESLRIKYQKSRSLEQYNKDIDIFLSRVNSEMQYRYEAINKML